jgi:hypothetical protein
MSNICSQLQRNAPVSGAITENCQIMAAVSSDRLNIFTVRK